MHNQTLRLILVLFVISAVSAGMLGWVNSITAPLIAERARQDANLARQEVLPGADGFFAVNDKIIKQIKQQYPIFRDLSVAKKGQEITGYVFTVAPRGYGGEVVAMLSLSREGTLLKVKIVSSNETPGLGTKIAEDKNPGDFLGKDNLTRMQNTPINEKISLTKDGGSIQAVAGATISSRAVVTGINTARDILQWIGQNVPDINEALADA